MSSSNEDVNLRRIREISKEEILRANVTHQRPHHRRRRGGGTTVRLTAKVAQMVASVREIVAQNVAM